MNRNEQPKPSRPALRFYLLAAFALLILWGVPDHALAQTQWTTAPNGTDIYNTTSGNVGIGTTPIPGYRLHIAGNNTAAGGYPLINIENKQTGGHSYWLYAGANNVPGDFGIYDSTTGMFPFLIKSNSNIGIGTSTPGYKLDVAGTINATAIYQNGSPFSSSQWTTGTGNISYNSGNVGIGTNAPTRRLTVFDSDANGATLALKTESSGLGTMDGFDLQFGSSNAFIWNRENGAMMFGTNNAERLRITNAGNVGIGTNAPGYKLDVNGIINATAIYQNGSPFSSSQWATNGANISYSTGNVGIGIAAPTTKLDVAGQVRSSEGGFKFPDGTVQTTAAVSGGGTITGVAAGTGLTGGGTTGSVTLTNADPGSSQSIFKNIADATGATQFAAGSNNDSLRFEGSGGTSITFNVANKKIVINSSNSGSTISAANVSEGEFGQNTGGGNFNFPGNVTVAGNLAAKYQDIAEWVPANRALPAGTVVVLNPTQSNQVMASTNTYDTRVAGVISERPGLALGEAGKDKVLVATTGRVKVKVDATRAPIRVGDLLVTSEKEGVAMKSQPLDLGGTPIHRPGTLIGKALEPLDKGTGEILVLLSLQ